MQAFGKVLLVIHRASGVEYAMKVMDKTKIVDKEQEKQIALEKDTMVQMMQNHHNFIVRLHWAFQTERKLFLVYGA